MHILKKICSFELSNYLK